MSNFLPGNLNSRVHNAFENLKVTAQKIPNLTVNISPGGFWNLSDIDSVYIKFNGTTTNAIEAPLFHNRWSVICLTVEGLITIIHGEELNQPILPHLPINQIPLAAIYFTQDTIAITSDNIYDIRSFLANPSPSTKSKINIAVNNTSVGVVHNINFKTGDNITFTTEYHEETDNLDLIFTTIDTVAQSSDTVVEFNSFNLNHTAGSSQEFSRGDHSHGSPENPIIPHLESYNHEYLADIPNILSELSFIKLTLTNILGGINGGHANTI
jgi:hypothetical protein